MDDPHDGPHAREPQIDDIERICGALNRAGARYVLIGGFAVIAHGGARTTKDIDLLVDPSPENVQRIKNALSILEDNAAAELADDEVGRYVVVRVADEVVIDLMARACGIDYHEAALDAERLPLGTVEVPVASSATLIRTKDTFRPSDAVDRNFLQAVISARGGKGA